MFWELRQTQHHILGFKVQLALFQNVVEYAKNHLVRVPYMYNPAFILCFELIFSLRWQHCFWRRWLIARWAIAIPPTIQILVYVYLKQFDLLNIQLTKFSIKFQVQNRKDFRRLPLIIQVDTLGMLCPSEGRNVPSSWEVLWKFRGWQVYCCQNAW